MIFLISVSIPLSGMEPRGTADVRLVASQAEERGSPQPKDRITHMTEREKEALDKFVHHEARFKDHYQSHFSTSNYEYHQYRPAYQHGFELALEPRYQKTDWNSVEPHAHRTWDEPTMGLWNQYKDAVRYGWEQGVALERK
jgi:hypothetical protein